MRCGPCISSLHFTHSLLLLSYLHSFIIHINISNKNDKRPSHSSTAALEPCTRPLFQMMMDKTSTQCGSSSYIISERGLVLAPWQANTTCMIMEFQLVDGVQFFLVLSVLVALPPLFFLCVNLTLANPSARMRCHSSPQGWQSHCVCVFACEGPEVHSTH